MTNQLFSFRNFKETYFSINQIESGFQIIKTVKNVLTKKESTKTFKKVFASYQKAKANIIRQMQTGLKIAQIWRELLFLCEELGLKRRDRQFWCLAKKRLEEKEKEILAFNAKIKYSD